MFIQTDQTTELTHHHMFQLSINFLGEFYPIHSSGVLSYDAHLVNDVRIEVCVKWFGVTN